MRIETLKNFIVFGVCPTIEGFKVFIHKLLLRWGLWCLYLLRAVVYDKGGY